MLNSDPLTTRPTLTTASLLAQALERLGEAAASKSDLLRLLTERYVVDLDAVAAILPRSEPEPIWLSAKA